MFSISSALIIEIECCLYGWSMSLYVTVCMTSMTTLYNSKYVIVPWHTICSDSPLEELTVD